ncbi:hypothetical protein TNCV_1401901 [Trichonephila clavipes]|nr:hypothetical protein TNCV_1401901 [Trichonephila clavipes]
MFRYLPPRKKFAGIDFEFRQLGGLEVVWPARLLSPGLWMIEHLCIDMERILSASSSPREKKMGCSHVIKLRREFMQSLFLKEVS